MSGLFILHETLEEEQEFIICNNNNYIILLDTLLKRSTFLLNLEVQN